MHKRGLSILGNVNGVCAVVAGTRGDWLAQVWVEGKSGVSVGGLAGRLGAGSV